MSVHSFNVSVGDQVFVGHGEEEVGAVREIAHDHLVIYVENVGEFRISGPEVLSAHDGKLVLDPDKIEPKLARAIGHAHDSETE